MQETEVSARDIHISDGSEEGDSMQPDLFHEQHISNNEQMVEAFRNLLLLHGQLPAKHGDSNTLLRYNVVINPSSNQNFHGLRSDDIRFLKMRDFDLEKAKDAFLSYMKWRVDSKVDMISKVIEKIGTLSSFSLILDQLTHNVFDEMSDRSLSMRSTVK